MRLRGAASRLLKNPAPGAVLGLGLHGSEDVVTGVPTPLAAKHAPEMTTRIGALRALQRIDGGAVKGSFSSSSGLAVRRFAAVASVGEGEEDLVPIEEERAIGGEGEGNSPVEDGLAMFASSDNLVNVTGEDVLKYITFRYNCAEISCAFYSVDSCSQF